MWPKLSSGTWSIVSTLVFMLVMMEKVVDSEAEIKHLDVRTDWAGGGHVRDRHLLDFLTTSGFLQT